MVRFPRWCMSGGWGYKIRRESNVLSRPVLAYVLHEIFAEMELRQVVWRITAHEFIIVVLSFLMVYASDGPCARRTSNVRICSRGFQGVLFPLQSCVIHLVDD